MVKQKKKVRCLLAYVYVVVDVVEFGWAVVVVDVDDDDYGDFDIMLMQQVNYCKCEDLMDRCMYAQTAALLYYMKRNN